MKIDMRAWTLALTLAATACGQSAGGQVPEVLRELPHEISASTQGLLFHEGLFYESTGQYGESTLREVDVATGEVLRMVELPNELFGEGLALVGDELFLLTWQEELGIVYDVETFEELRRFEYEGEGWGLCYDGRSLFMSNGSAILHRRDPVTFEILESREVTQDGRPVRNLNELECVGDFVYANVYQSDRIVRIDKASGVVIAEYDGSVLQPEAGRPMDVRAVLNGIAHDPASDTFYLTGKTWPSMFEVRLDP